jgi:hypothetical protein
MEGLNREKGKRKELKMKKFLLVALLGAFGIDQQLKAEEATSNNTIDYTLDHGYKLDGNDVYGEHDLNYTHKFSDDLKVAFQGHFVEHYRVVGDGGKVETATYEDKFWRLKFIGSPFLDIAGFKTGWEVRYFLPLASKDQQAGTYGTFAPRLTLAREFNSHYNLSMVAKASLPLNRKSYQANSLEKKANALTAVGFEVTPQWKILPDLTLTNTSEVVMTVLGKAPYATKDPTKEITYSCNFSNEMELGYSIKNFYNLGVSAFWQIDYDFGNGALSSAEASIKKGSHHTVGIRLAKSFDL